MTPEMVIAIGKSVVAVMAIGGASAIMIILLLRRGAKVDDKDKVE